VARYRRKDVPTAYKKIDTAFWTKYKQISRGNEFAVAQCLGGEDLGPAAAPQIKKASVSKPVAKAGKSPRIENIAWIRKRNSKHFTLQLAAVSSEQAVKNLIKKHTQPGIFAYYRRIHKGRDLYIAIYGHFSNHADAEKAAGQFAPLKPWIREFGSIQEIMLKK
jgi:DamX protein